MLAARLDRLPPEAKRLVQLAAVIGPEVPVLLLQRLAGLAEDTLQRGLAHLQDTSCSTRPVSSLSRSIPLSMRSPTKWPMGVCSRSSGGRCMPDYGSPGSYRWGAGVREIDQLAHHAFQGAVWDKTVTYYQQVGARALERAAFREAAAAFEQALVALQQLPESRTTREQAIDLRVDLHHALLPLGEFGRVLDHLRQAEPLAEALGDPRRLVMLARCRASCVTNLGDPDSSLASAQRALTLATALEDVGLRVGATNPWPTFTGN